MNMIFPEPIAGTSIDEYCKALYAVRLMWDTSALPIFLYNGKLWTATPWGPLEVQS